MPASGSPSALITGGAGYLASALAPRLQSQTGLIRLMHRSHGLQGALPGSVPGRCEDFQGDARNRADVEKAMSGVDRVFHLAAQTSLYVANADPAADYAANVVPLLNILEVSRSRKIPAMVICAGTATQMGMPDRLPVDESHADRPMSIYDSHKLLAEQYLEHYARNGWVRGAVLRLANVYGPGVRSGSGDRGILNAMIRKALRGETLKIFGTGEFLRDYVYVDDVADAFALAAEGMDSINGRHFVIGSGQGHTLSQAIQLVADRVGERLGRKVMVEHVDPPKGQSVVESRNFIADPSAFRKNTGWKPQVELKAGIDRTIEHFLFGESR